MSQVPAFSSGDGICNWNLTLPTDGESESAGADWLRFLQKTAQDFALNEHDCNGKHTLRGVVAVVFGDSPLSVAFSTHGGRLLAVNTSGGNVVVNLPAISAWRAGVPLLVKKVTSDANTVTINRGSTDTVEGGTSLTLNTFNQCIGIWPDSTSKWYQVWLGGVITDAFLGPTIAKGRQVSKLSDTGKAGDDTIADDPDLVIPLQASSFYSVEAVIFVTQGGNDDSKIEWIWNRTFTLAGIGFVELEELVDKLSTSWTPEGSGDTSVRITDLATTARTLSSNSSVQRRITLKGVIRTAGVGGNFSFQWAQQASTSPGRTTSVLKGSYIKVRKT